jgi:hypothetical protein
MIKGVSAAGDPIINTNDEIIGSISVVPTRESGCIESEPKRWLI